MTDLDISITAKDHSQGDLKITITEAMRSQAYSVYRNCWARDNANYPLELEIYKQNSNDKDIPFEWDIPKEIKIKAQEVNDLLFKEYLESLTAKLNKRQRKNP